MKAEFTLPSDLCGIVLAMTSRDKVHEARAIDLPSLLATTSARQAMTPTSRMQARLAAANQGQKTSALEPKLKAELGIRTGNSPSFNYLARKLLSGRSQ